MTWQQKRMFLDFFIQCLKWVHKSDLNLVILVACYQESHAYFREILDKFTIVQTFEIFKFPSLHSGNF